MSKFRVRDTNGKHILEWKYDDFIQTERLYDLPPMNVIYQDPSLICYSHHTKIDWEVTVDAIDIYFYLSKIRTIQNGKMFIYVHYNNQLVRNMRYLHKIAEFQGIEPSEKNNQITFDLNYISLMRLREDSQEPCDLTLQNEDRKWMKQISNIVGCVPSYWKIFLHDEVKTPFIVCNTSLQLKKMTTYLPYKNEAAVKKVFRLYDPPCYRMRVLANSHSSRYHKKDLLKLKFRFRYHLLNQVKFLHTFYNIVRELCKH